MSAPVAHGWRRWSRLTIVLLADLLLVNVSLGLALFLNYRSVMDPAALQVFRGYALPITALAGVMMFWRGLYRVSARYYGMYDFLSIGFVCAILASALGILEGAFPAYIEAERALIIPVLFGLIAIALLSGARIVRRAVAWRVIPLPRAREDKLRRRAIVVGAGDAGEALVREMSRSRFSNYFVVGFVDDDPEKANMRIHGIRVLGKIEDLPKLVDEFVVAEAIIAIPHSDGPTMRRIVDICNRSAVRVRTMPVVASVLRGDAQTFKHLRNVEIDDLLRRPTVKTDLSGVEKYVNGERVLITGAGGSIGSELARQIANFSPSSLILLGKGENSIFEIEQELLRTRGLQPRCTIADVRDARSIERAFEEHQPTVVFHAAAHKHVPLMEGNVLEAIDNNVRGTLVTAETAVRFGVKRFVYVSTDKAVKPLSIMGATKRIGEMLVACVGQQTEMETAIVRFGNVLGSRGSLIPMLKAQIKAGGPVRLTHEDMTRYFMTIPEAVQLILQAGAIGKSGDVFILDMGEPMRIVDLAYDLIRLHGLVPNEDIQVVFTGIRPGEKLNEELTYEQEELLATVHPKISVVRNGSHTHSTIKQQIRQLCEFCETGKTEHARQALMDLAWGKSIEPFEVAAMAVVGDPVVTNI
jgi:FlaA1/EpsC-like NDP-sugar epimerase